jgi:putative membrane protein
MFIDFLDLMLINLFAGLTLLAFYIYKNPDDPDQKSWVPGFAAVGLIALVTGFVMVFTWPLPSSFNIAFGSPSILFGALFLAAAFSLAKNWDPGGLAIYAFIAGTVAIVIGARIIDLEMTRNPSLTGTGFILTGLGGVALAASLYFRTLRSRMRLRWIMVAILLAAAAIWAYTAYDALWGHLESFTSWTPATLG